MKPSLSPRMAVVVLLLAMIAPAFVPASTASAASYPCTEAGVVSAFAAGGAATFSCAGATNVLISQTFVADKNVQLDGGGLLTLKRDSGFNGQLFYVLNGFGLTLSNMTIRDFNASTAGAVALVDTSGSLTATNVVFLNNSTSGALSGGAIFNKGTTTLINSTLEGNFASASGGAIYVDTTGKLTADTSTFKTNTTLSSKTPGGAIYSRGTVTFTNSVFQGNVSAAEGGALATSAAGKATINGSTFRSNAALGGGALSLANGATISSSSFISNTASPGSLGTNVAGRANGGAIVVTGSLTINQTLFDHNSASATGGSKADGAAYGGAIYLALGATGGITITSSSFVYNTAVGRGGVGVGGGGQGQGHGGAIFNGEYATRLYIQNSTFTNNAAEGRGANGNPSGTNPGDGSADGGAIKSEANNTTIINSTIALNSAYAENGTAGPNGSATAEGGGIATTGGLTAHFLFNTIVSNTVDAKALTLLRNGAGIALGPGATTAYFTGTIAASNRIAGVGTENCTQNVTALTSKGYNLSDDSTCKFTGTGDLQNASAAQVGLAALADNGGPTVGAGGSPGALHTYLPLAGSNAVDNGGTVCPSTDERGAARPYPAGGKCDKGAVEIGGSVIRVFAPVAVKDYALN